VIVMSVSRAMRGRRLMMIGRVMIVPAVGRASARMPRPRAAQRNDRRDDAAEQREENDRLIHKKV